MFIDTHSHINMISTEKDIPVENIIDELKQYDVDTVVDICGSKEDFIFHKSVEKLFSDNKIDFYASAGIHPHEADRYVDTDISWIKNISKEIFAVGEIGLDFFYDFSSVKNQEIMLRTMVEQSIELNLPLLIHGRCGEEQILKTLEDYNLKNGRVLFHCYTGPLDIAERILANHWLISFSGILTFKKSEDVRKILMMTPRDQIFFETDSPFLAPVPFRGSVNTPAKVRFVYEYAANLLDIDVNILAEQVRKNFINFFNLNND